jgi:lipopolysaccharide/colanic/teichoic acid biosynthesis glycosyltransferase
VVLEAAAAGKPVVATRATGAIDAVQHGITGLLVPVGDPAALAQAFTRLLENPGLAAKMGAAGMERVKQDYATETVCRHLADLYHRLLKQSAVSAGAADHRCSAASRATKRLADLLGAVVGLAIAGPLMAAAGAAVWATMGSPVLFRQRRAGLHGRPFPLLKFRTMTDARDAQGRLLPDAERLTVIGGLLRRCSIDELPQLWNVLKGEMSLVGPRPLYLEYLPAYTERHQLRHALRPGLTGCSQVNGRHTALFSRRLELDSWYVENWSLWLDARIVLETIPKVLCSVDTAACQDASVDDLGFWRLLGPASRSSGPPPSPLADGEGGE